MIIQPRYSFRSQPLVWVLAVISIAFLPLSASAQPRRANAGAILKPSTSIEVPYSVLRQISDAKDVEAYAVLPNRDELVVYDTVRDDHRTADFLENRPHIAIIRGTTVLLNIDAVSIAPASPVSFAGMALFPVTQAMPLMAFAFRLALDQAGTFFVFIDSTTNSYKVSATLEGAQAQLRFNNDSSGRFELWRAGRPFSRDPEKQCVWCAAFYKTTSYKWTDGKLRRLGTVTSKGGYDPTPYFESPFLLEK